MTPPLPVVIIGGGMGGLAAAVRLSAAGVPVLVLERGERLGGKADVVTIDGVQVDTGPSVLTLPEVFDALLRTAGTTLADELAIHLPEPACRYVYPQGGVVDVFSDHDRTVASVREGLGDQAADELAGFLAYAARVWDNAAPWFVFGTAPTPIGVLGLGPRAWAAVPRIDPLRTMQRAIDAHVHHRDLRWLLLRYATYNGSDPRRAPATLNCIAHVELGLGIYGVAGGIHSLVDALERVARRHGAQIRCQAEVTGIRCGPGQRVQGVTLADGSFVAARAVIANADAAHVLADLLPAGVRHGLPTHPTPSMSGWTGIVRARRTPDRVGHTVLFPAGDYLEEFVDIFDRDRPPVEPTVYLCAQERAHGRTGWPDHEPIFIMANAPAEPEDGPRAEPGWVRLRDTVMARLVAAGLIQAEDTLVWERNASDLAARFPGSRGSIYGAASNDLFAAFRRPPNRVRAVPGLYLASGSAHPGGGMPLCAQSGRAAAEALLAEEPHGT